MCEEITNTNIQPNFMFSKDPYVFDIDKNGFPALTTKNVALIEFIIHNDSNYRALGDSETDSISKTIDNYYNPKDPKKILKIVEIIDKQNSTHLASMGRGHKGDNSGRVKTANYIATIPDITKRLENRDFELVNDIALNAIPPSKDFKGRYIFSFASKYCTYVARTLFRNTKEADNFSIFDDVISKILPYYAWTYLGDESFCRIKSKKRKSKEGLSLSPEKERVSTIKHTFGAKNNGNYQGYCELIDKIRNAATMLFKDDKPISRKGFDHLLWYYFKGDSKRIKKALKLVGNNSAQLL